MSEDGSPEPTPPLEGHLHFSISNFFEMLMSDGLESVGRKLTVLEEKLLVVASICRCRNK